MNTKQGDNKDSILITWISNKKTCLSI